MDVSSLEFEVLEYETRLGEGYSITTVEEAGRNIESVSKAFHASNVKEEVRLKNGILMNQGDNTCRVNIEYQPRVKFKLISKQKTEKQLTKEDCLIALAYAAEHDDVEEAEELVKCAGPEILKTRMPFANLGTFLHVCTNWASFQTLKTLLRNSDLAGSFDASMTDYEGDTALHNLPDLFAEEIYEDCKTAAQLLLGLPGVDANTLLGVQNSYGRQTALHKALTVLCIFGKDAACRAILDAAAEKTQRFTGLQQAAAPAPSWLALKAQGEWIAKAYIAVLTDMKKKMKEMTIMMAMAQMDHIISQHHCGYDENASTTALHLAVLSGNENIVKQILEFPGAGELKLTSLCDHNGDTPLHIAAMLENPENICSMILRYGAESNDHHGGSVRSQNKLGQTPLHIASTRGHARVCKKLLEYGGSLTTPDHHRRYALTNAFVNNHDEAVLTLLDACFPPKSAPDTPLATASEVRDGHDLINATSKGMHKRIKEHFEFGLTALHVAVAMASDYHIRHLIEAGAPVDAKSEDDRTPLHVAAEHQNKTALNILLDSAKHKFRQSRPTMKKAWINTRDKSGQTGLHKLVRLSVQGCPTENKHELHIYHSGWESSELTIPPGEEKPTDDEESAGKETITTGKEIAERVRTLLEEGAWVDLQDCLGETPLHAAVRLSDEAVVTALLSETVGKTKNFRSGKLEARDKWICMCDFSGETALHEAARVGNQECISLLLKETSSPDDLLRIVDMENRTALDWAILTHKTHHKSKQIVDEMMRSAKKEITKEFLMWHLKEYTTDPSEYCRNYFDGGKVPDQTSLLRRAAEEAKDVDMARELINRGADVAALDYNAQRWLAEHLSKTASDQPTSKDTLGRRELVQGVTTLLLNPYTQTPVTIGIFGRWGIGKSSFMLQVEEAMLSMAIKEAFRKLPDSQSPHDSKSIVNFSTNGVALQCIVAKTLKRLWVKSDHSRFDHGKVDAENQTPSKNKEDIISKFPMELVSTYRQIFRSLALTDRSKLVQCQARTWFTRNAGMYGQTLQDTHLIAYTPAILTLYYNAWQYDNKNEASAGLAVEISHHLEKSMTPHQWLRMCWKYSWKSRPREIFVHVLLPTLLAIVLISVILMLWKLIPIPTKYKSLSLPMGIVGVLWALFKVCLQVIQPVTQTMLNLTKLADHQSMLGYQHQVIDDIKFLKSQLCEDAHFGWKFLSFFFQLFISNSYFMEGTWIWKQHPCSNNFRIVVFIDDLDRCDEKTILEILRAINLILGSCGISAVIGVDKHMVTRAITREFLKDTSDEIIDLWVDSNGKPTEKDERVEANLQRKRAQEEKDQEMEEKSKKEISQETKDSREERKNSYLIELADTYLQKIIQLPIQMPDPSGKHIKVFVQGQVGQHPFGYKTNKVEDLKTKDQEDISQKQEGISVKDNVGEKNVKQSRGSQSIEMIEEDNKEEQVKRQEDPQNQDGEKNGTSKSIAFQLLLANYTPMEKDMLNRLCQSTTKDRRIPREWKRFFNYHRLAWTILSQDPDMQNPDFKGWQRKLIIWIFVCWNWRAQMDDIFMDWQDLLSKSLMQELKKDNDNTLQLCDIINTYIESKGWATKEDIDQNQGKQTVEAASKDWINLYTTVKDEYDISMSLIEKFQQFRFYCVLNHLEIGENLKRKNVTHLTSFKPIKTALKGSHRYV